MASRPVLDSSTRYFFHIVSWNQGKEQKKKKNRPQELLSTTTTNNNNTEEKHTQNTEVKIKQENIDKTESKVSYNSTENKKNVEKNEDTSVNGSHDKDNTINKANKVTQSPTGKRRSTPMSASNKKKRYFTPITELLHSGAEDQLPTLTQIIEKTDRSKSVLLN